MRATSKELNVAFVFFVLQGDGPTSGGAYTEVGGGGEGGGGGQCLQTIFYVIWVKTKKEMQCGLF